MDFEEFRVNGKKVVDYICDYQNSLPERDVATAVEPLFLDVGDKMPEKPDSFDDVMKDFNDKIMPGVLHWAHPNFYAYFGPGGAYPSILGDMLSTATRAVGFSWASCPALTELEISMLDWFAKMMNLPKDFLSKRSNPGSRGGAALQNSASEGTFVAMSAARYRAIKALKGDDTETPDSYYLPRLVAYSSSQAHSSVEKAARINLCRIHLLKPDDRDSVRGDSLEKVIQYDMKNGLVPFFVCGSFGTTSQTAIDNLAEIAKVKRKYPLMWFHVDGAYGGNSFILPEMERMKRGLDCADSIVVNTNKMLLTAFDCTCLFLRDIVQFAKAFVVNPVYLEHQHEKSVIDLRHLGTPLSRRFRALKLFFMFRCYGVKKLQEYVRGVLQSGKWFEEMVYRNANFETNNDVYLGLVCFRLRQPEKINREFFKRLQGSCKIHLTAAIVKGHYVVRFVANQEIITREQIEEAWALIEDIGMKLLEENGLLLSDFERKIQEQNLNTMAGFEI